MSLVTREIKQEEEPKFLYCQTCLKCMPFTSESNVIHYNFHTDLYMGVCFSISCKKNII